MNTTKPPECWASDGNARALRVETSPGKALLLPFDQFVFAECQPEEKEQRLRLVFATHEVVVRGHSLRRVETAMQRMELSHLACLPGNYRSVVGDGQPFIREIAVEEVKKQLNGRERAVELTETGIAQFLKYVEDVCMPRKRDPFSALMEVAQDQQGFFTTKQAIKAGYADNTHPYHGRAGNWEHIWRGIYRLHHYPSPEDGDKVAWYLWSRGRNEEPMGVYSHETALSLFDLGDFNPSDLHMIVPLAFRRNGPVPKGVVLHRGTVPPADRTRLRGFAVCRPLRALMDLAKTNPTAIEDFRRVLSDARRRGLITERELEAKRKECRADSMLKAVLA